MPPTYGCYGRIPVPVLQRGSWFWRRARSIGQPSRHCAASNPFVVSTFHSACWRHGTEIKGKHVAVIGTGASAAQCVPHTPRRRGAARAVSADAAMGIAESDPAFSPRQSLGPAPCSLAADGRCARGFTGPTRRAHLVSCSFPSLMAAPERRARSHAKRQVPSDALRHLLTPADRMGASGCCSRMTSSPA